MKTKITATFITIFLFINLAFAGNKKNQWLIITQEKDTIAATVLSRIIDSTLYFECKNCNGKIPLKSIEEIVRVKYPHYVRNISIGTVSGFVAGTIIGAAAGPNQSDEFLGVFLPSYADVTALEIGIIGGTIAGAIIGTAVSLSNRQNKFYLLRNQTFDEKKIAVAKICAVK